MCRQNCAKVFNLYKHNIYIYIGKLYIITATKIDYIYTVKMFYDRLYNGFSLHNITKIMILKNLKLSII